MDWLFATVALLVALLIFVGLLVHFSSFRWAMLGLLVFAGLYTYIETQLTSSDAEKPSEAEKPAEAEKPTEAEKSAEAAKPTEAEKPSEDGVAATVRLAAEQGRADAQFAMGRKYEDGHGVPQYYAEAMKWYRLAAEQGHAWAQFRLGMMYREGRGVPHDFVQAYMWLNLAASRFPASETKYRDSAIQNRDRAASRLTPEQLAEAQRLAREWKPKPAAP